MRARDIMSSPVHTVRQTASVQRAAQLLAARAVTAMPVVDRTGVVVGMVSESDLLRHRVPAGRTAHLRPVPDLDPAARPRMVREVMSPHLFTTRPDADVAEVAEVMLDNDVRSMPVLDDGALVGIVSRRDILRVVLRGDDVLAHEIRHRLDEYADGQHPWTVTVLGGVAHVTGDFSDDAEKAMVIVLARTVPGVGAVQVGATAP